MRGHYLFGKLAAMALGLGMAFAGGAAQAQTACLPGSAVICLDQGPSWTNATRAQFYSQDQGSELIPLSWLDALRTSDGLPFLWDKLARYGYLPDSFRSGNLPIGFTLAGDSGKQMVGMTCAACHTRDLVVDGQTYRVDGGPAIVDFQALLVDLIDAMEPIATNEAAFQAFAAEVLGAHPTPNAVNDLRAQVTTWYAREDAMRDGAFAKPDLWGLGRLDAISMIFDRLTGLDLAVPPALSLPANIQEANAPSRYPFLWNASKQTIIQWPGFSPNGSEFFGLIRNTGEVYGVFGGLHPQIGPGLLGPKVVKVWNSSANWSGLVSAEQLIGKIGAPAWQWPNHVDPALALRGKTLFYRDCGSCHNKTIKPAVFPFTDGPTWASEQPLVDVGTDRRENDILHGKRLSGIFTGVQTFPGALKPLAAEEEAVTLLGVAVTGSIFDSGKLDLVLKGKKVNKAALFAALIKTIVPKKKPADKPANPYESRILYGVWAAAPYLHNGSVPTLWDLLKPSSQRPVTFAVGPEFDPVRIGVAAKQPGNYSRTTTGCDALDSGNSRCGHEGPGFGTDLPDADKRALLEYLKTL
jgi:mono/diheme cytochrome c family protein